MLFRRVVVYALCGVSVAIQFGLNRSGHVGHLACEYIREQKAHYRYQRRGGVFAQCPAVFSRRIEQQPPRYSAQAYFPPCHILIGYKGQCKIEYVTYQSF